MMHAFNKVRENALLQNDLEIYLNTFLYALLSIQVI